MGINFNDQGIRACPIEIPQINTPGKSQVDKTLRVGTLNQQRQIAKKISPDFSHDHSSQPPLSPLLHKFQ
jgi:hypothetical protein